MPSLHCANRGATARMADDQGKNEPASGGGDPASTSADAPVQIAKMLEPAVQMASEANLPFLAYLLNMALQEAARVAQISISLREADQAARNPPK